MIPKDIINQIHGNCFDYKPMEECIDNKTIEERLSDCYKGLISVLGGWAISNEAEFISFIKKTFIEINNEQ